MLKNMERRYFNIAETAIYTGFSVKTLYRWSRCGMMPCAKIGRLLKFDKNDLDIWIKNHKKEAINDYLL